jgi:hypothetical protein
MTIRNVAAVFCIVLAMFSGNAWSQQSKSFNLAADFSPQQNPNGVWEYGYSATSSLDPPEFRLDHYSNQGVPVSFWHPEHTDQPGPGYYPYVAGNNAGKTSFGSSNGWAVRADEIAMEGSNSGQYSMVRFVAPQAGSYAVSAKFAGIHFGLSTTDVHVLLNGSSLFAADIDGYGGDPAFHAITGASPTADYAGTLKMKRGDTVTFAVGYGRNKTNYGDTTGLIVHVTLFSAISEPKTEPAQPGR